LLGYIYSHSAAVGQQSTTKPTTQATTQPTTSAAATENLWRAALEPTTPEDGNWTMPAKNFANTRYSGLDQINTDNVSKLQVAWTFSTGLQIDPKACRDPHKRRVSGL
jgi:glucose dehydrogenase